MHMIIYICTWYAKDMMLYFDGWVQNRVGFNSVLTVGFKIGLGSILF